MSKARIPNTKFQKPKPKDRSFKKILIVRLDRIGDVILSTPAIRAVHDAYPASYIAVMVRPYAREILEGNPYCNEVIVYDKSGSEKSVAGNARFIRGLRKKRFDLAILLHPTQRTHLLAAAAGIPVRVGYGKKWPLLLTKRIPHTKQFGLKHEIDYTLDMLRHIGIEAKERSLYMPVAPDAERRIAQTFKENGIKDSDTVVAIHPGASCPSKRWKAENFAAVGNALAKKQGARIVIMAGKDDRFYGDRVAALMDEACLNLSGKTSVSEVASVLRRSALFISNDSGPVHIACAVGTPVVAIFGRSDRGLSPERWGPSGKHSKILHKNVGCERCLAHACTKRFKCLEAVTVKETLEAAATLLKRKKR